jgi:hypothetical protein
MAHSAERRFIMLKKLLTNSKFWMALFTVGQNILFHFVTDFPENIWVSISGLVVIVLGVLTYQDVRAK